MAQPAADLALMSHHLLQFVLPILLICVVPIACVVPIVGCGQPQELGTEAKAAISRTAEDFNADEGHLPRKDEPLAVGQRAPDFEVEVLGGQSLRLHEFLARSEGPTVLLFDRAHW